MESEMTFHTESLFFESFEAILTSGIGSIWDLASFIPNFTKIWYEMSLYFP